MYKGEVNVGQNCLPSFLKTAESLQVIITFKFIFFHSLIATAMDSSICVWNVKCEIWTGGSDEFITLLFLLVRKKIIAICGLLPSFSLARPQTFRISQFCADFSYWIALTYTQKTPWNRLPHISGRSVIEKNNKSCKTHHINHCVLHDSTFSTRNSRFVSNLTRNMR